MCGVMLCPWCRMRGTQCSLAQHYEWFYHVRLHDHVGHCIGEFATVIWRLDSFSLIPWWRPQRNGLRELVSVNRRTPQWARGQFTKKPNMPAWFEKWHDIRFWYMCKVCSSLELWCVSLIDDAQNMQNELSMGTWSIYKNYYASLVRKCPDI